MLPMLRQIRSVTRINLLSLPQRAWMSLSAIIAIAFVVFVLLGALALDNGFRQALGNSGSNEIAILLREGSSGGEINSFITNEQRQLMSDAPGIARGADGKPMVSPELYVVVDGIKKSTNTKANLPLRGVGLGALQARKGVRIVAGRMFATGSNEIIIGAGVLKEFDGFALGQTKRFGANTWKVVGVFEAGGSIFESELWADIGVVQSLFNRGSSIQSMRVRLQSPAAIKQLEAFSKADPRLKLEVKSEQDYYAGQAKQSGDLISRIGKPLAVIMAFGALAGALNTMYASVSAQAPSIATLRTIGFSGVAAFFGTLSESLVLALLGALLGSAAAYAYFNGMSASTLGGSFTQVVFNLALSSKQLIEGTIWATALGFLGGVFPAWRAARQPILSVNSD